MSHPHELPLPCPPNAFEEPASQTDHPRSLPVDPQHVRLEVTLDPREARVTGRVVHTVRVLAESLSHLAVDAADMQVTEARIGGAPVAVSPFTEGVMLTLNEPQPWGAELTVELSFEARPTQGLYFVGPDEHHPDRRPQAWTQGAMEDHHHWFPCFDGPEHMVTSEVIATVPEGFVAISNGVPIEGEVADAPAGQARFHWRHDTPHALYLVTLVVDTLAEVKASHGEITLHHYVPPGREADAAELFCRVGEMLEVFARTTGRPYPYPRYGHVFLQGFMWGGMENTTLTSLTDQVLVEGRHRLEEDVERLIAHELAHQWFGDLIAPRGWAEIWLNESFATYFEQICMGALDGDDDFQRRMLAQRDAYLDEARSRYARAVVTRRYAHPYVLFDRHAYEKGCLVLHTLRDQLGDAAFFRGVQTYVARMAGQAAETADLKRAFEESTGASLGAFFEQWVYAAAHPKVQVRWRWSPGTGLSVDLDRTDEGEQSVDLTLAIGLGGGPGEADGEVLIRRIPLGPGRRSVALPEIPPPAWVVLDPAQHALVEIDESYEADASLIARLTLRSGFDAAPLRARTARLLGARPSAAVAAALAHTARQDPSQMVRIEAVRALGAHQTDATRKALASVVEGQDTWRVRAAAAAAMGAGASEAHATWAGARLEAEVDGSHRVRCGLVRGLAKVKEPAAQEVIRRWLDAPSPRDCVAAAAVSALAAQEDAEVVDEVALRTEPGHPRAVRAAALRGLAQLASALEDKPIKKRARTLLEGALHDAELAIQLAAISGLVKLGDADARAALERTHRGGANGLVRRAVREALGRLKSPAGAPA